ncbi:MAG: M1 family aminopeptidase, partial [Flavobacteriales bacterium]
MVTLDFSAMPSSDIVGVTELQIVQLQEHPNIHLDFQGLDVDSVFVNDQPVAYQQSSPNLYINYAALAGDTIFVRVHYQGSPQTDATWGGVYFSSGYAFNLGVAFTSVPHNFGRVLYPCLDNFIERSTYDFNIITTPDRRAYCSGVLLGVDTLANANRIHHWSLTVPIPSYLVGVAVSSYSHVEQSYSSVDGDQIPMWLVARPVDTTDMKLSMVHLPEAMGAFEDRFGSYNWPRVGFVAVPFNAGAMEHATNIAYPLFAVDGTTTYETLFAHELSHHWWGDWVTCRTASDMWLNEGWARFCEALFLEATYGSQAYRDEIRANHKDVLLYAHRNDGARLPVSGIPSEVAYGDHVYNK